MLSPCRPSTILYLANGDSLNRKTSNNRILYTSARTKGRNPTYSSSHRANANANNSQCRDDRFQLNPCRACKSGTCQSQKCDQAFRSINGQRDREILRLGLCNRNPISARGEERAQPSAEQPSH
jgi:hypothetical protein